VNYINAPEPPAIVMVDADHGGRFDVYEAATNRYRFEGRRIYISGRCASACTMALSLKTTCVYPQASLGFHLPYYKFGDTTGAHSEAESVAYFTKRLWNFYPSRVQARLGTLTPDMRNISGAELIAVGVPACPGTAVAAVDPFTQLVKNLKSRIDQY
jgi:hypothetical protein